MQHRELHVFGAEIVAPLRDAVRLVDGEQREFRAREQIQRAVEQQALGGDIQQVEFAAQQLRFDGARLRRVERGIEKFRAHAGLLQRRHLVLHQRDQRRHHDAGTGAGDGRNLEAQRLAAAGRHEHQRVAAGHERADHFRLRAAEAFVAEDAVEDVKRLVVHADGEWDAWETGGALSVGLGPGSSR